MNDRVWPALCCSRRTPRDQTAQRHDRQADDHALEASRRAPVVTGAPARPTSGRGAGGHGQATSSERPPATAMAPRTVGVVGPLGKGGRHRRGHSAAAGTTRRGLRPAAPRAGRRRTAATLETARAAGAREGTTRQSGDRDGGRSDRATSSNRLGRVRLLAASPPGAACSAGRPCRRSRRPARSGTRSSAEAGGRPPARRRVAPVDVVAPGACSGAPGRRSGPGTPGRPAPGTRHVPGRPRF
jgi:hypothetical protein